ncbi:MAG TPA: Uma2 family endonuclease [Verrucomicrobiota bacterium]|nr:Uma2 family endonuclease [Verrucomicrobiota bacterium]
MSTAEKYEIVSEAGYLALEEHAAERHELVGGVMYAMAGETTTHNLITQNLFLAVHGRVRGRGCRPFFNGVKLRLPVATTFYYPDLMVTCDPRDTDERFIQHPRLIIEVLSESTQATDRREKLFAYLQIPTMEEYVLVSSLTREVVVHRRAEGWEPRPLPSDAPELPLATLDLRLPLDRIYEGVTF